MKYKSKALKCERISSEGLLSSSFLRNNAVVIDLKKKKPDHYDPLKLLSRAHYLCLVRKVKLVVLFRETKVTVSPVKNRCNRQNS